jgi:CheY-like chemotaxis protein
MSDPIFNDSQHNYFEEIQKAAERASSLTQQLLAFSRGQIIEPKIIDLNHLIVDTSKMLRSVINENIELVTLLDPNLYKVKVDPDQMRQALINLATNARDAMPNGGKFTVETRNVTLVRDQSAPGSEIMAGDYVVLNVSDDGIGMTPYVKEHLFEPFFTTKEVGKGTGLGLATCYGIAKQNGGHIEVSSDPAFGTTFQLHLPRAVEQEMSPPSDDEPVRLVPGAETILIVEDEPSVRNMVVRILYEQGYKVLEAANGEEALRVVHTHADETIHLLFTDMVMPQMGGRELVEQLKSVRPGTKILLTSGYINEVVNEDGKLADDIPFLQKPFMPGELVRKVQEVLSN